MTDRDVERELEANQQRADQAARDADDGPIVETLATPFPNEVPETTDDEADEDNKSLLDKARDAAQSPE